jgi:acetylornithine/succinyldiaminopimelate/putrescine aminotransferase
MPESTPVSTVSNQAAPVASVTQEEPLIQAHQAVEAVADTCDRLIRERIPNFLRIYLNPYVAQACHCLNAMIHEAWPTTRDSEGYQVFLANSGEEALSGAIKLLRYAANQEGQPTAGLVVDDTGFCPYFSETIIDSAEDRSKKLRLEYLPGIEYRRAQRMQTELPTAENHPLGFVVASRTALKTEDGRVVAPFDDKSSGKPRPHLVVLADPQMTDAASRVASCPPDVVVFDDRFTGGELPFGAFVATKRLFRHWNRRGMATFHSTTFQPNSVAAIHFLRCLGQRDPEFMASQAATLARIESDPAFRRSTFESLFSRSLSRLAAATGGDHEPVRAAGHYFSLRGSRVFDAVAGVACSIRGHNPPTYSQELRAHQEFADIETELAERLRSLTGLEHSTPAVSGASAVESALRMALASQAPRDYVLTLEGGFGGKTLMALTGTSKAFYKRHVGPLYPKRVCVDPFRHDSLQKIEAAFRDYPIGVVQLELIQGVGGVKPLPPLVMQRLVELRERYACLLFVDEIQTGLFRTGPFLRCETVGLKPDLATIGKGASDMMIPTALTLYSSAIQARLKDRGCDLPDWLRRRYRYEAADRTLLNTLRRASASDLSAEVMRKGLRLERIISGWTKECPRIAGVRCYGLLLGIEISLPTPFVPLSRSLVAQLYLSELLNHPRFPVLGGFCQYEPNVLKFTPPLTITDDEVDLFSETLISALSRPLYRVAHSALRQQLGIPRLSIQRQANACQEAL